VMLRLLDHLKKLGIYHPRKIEPWPNLEADFTKQYSQEEQEKFLAILDWAFTRHHFRKAFADPKKKDVIRFFVNNSDDMRADFEVNRAREKLIQSSLAARSEPRDDKFEEKVPQAEPKTPPVENREPTRPLGGLFFQGLNDIGVTVHDTSSWDAIEEALPTKCNAAQIEAAPEAIKLVLSGEEDYWYKLMFNGTKANRFAFFCNNLPKILRSIQDSKARNRHQTTKKKEGQEDDEEYNQWAGMVPS
jgi:hypothetical protein